MQNSTPVQGFRSKAVRGLQWLASGAAVEQAVRFARNILLARILVPDAFGTMALVISATSLLASLSDIGVREAVIQNPRGTEKHYLNAAWWMAFGRSVFLYCLLFLSAPTLAHFYNNAHLTPLLRVASLAILFEGAISSRAYAAIKDMRFGRWAAVTHAGALVGVLTAVFLCLWLRNVWGLVIGYSIENLGRCLFSYAVCPWKPSLKIKLDAVRDLGRFSRRTFGLSVLNLVLMRADIFLLARFYPASRVGVYTMAVYLVQTPTSFVMNILGQVFLPIFSQVQCDLKRVNRILLQMSLVILQVAIPGIAFIWFFGSGLLSIIYGRAYAAGAPALVLAACVGLVNVLNGQITTALYGLGLPHFHRRGVAIAAVLMLLAVYPAIKYFGVAGGQLALLIALGTEFLFQLQRLRNVTGLAVREYGQNFLRGWLGSSSYSNVSR